MIHRIQLSRLTHPRASLATIILLAVVFGLFGVVASALHPELSTAVPGAAPITFEGAAALVRNSMFCS